MRGPSQPGRAQLRCWCPTLASLISTLPLPPQFYAFFIKPVLGATAVIAVTVAVGTSLAAAVGFIPTALAEAANGGSYEGAGAAKAAMLVAATTAVVAACTVPRVRLSPLPAGIFYITSLLVVVRIYATYWVRNGGKRQMMAGAGGDVVGGWSY